jgi:hyaluronoglucosaminidase
MLPLRATVEGFYGRPWSHEERLEHLAFSAAHGFNAYLYGPKDDPFHRERWRQPYPPDELDRMRELVAAADGLDFVFAIHPGLSMAWDDDAEQDALHAKAAQLWAVGVRRFALFFDDIELGDDPGATGAAHGRVCARFVAGFLAPRGAAPTADAPFLMVPTDYAGTEASAYRTRLGESLPDHTAVCWTGSEVVVRAVTEAEVEAARASFGRPLVLWDNFPVNDFEPARLFLGPLVDRPRSPDALLGITANPMVQPRASRVALATVGEYARDPAGYDPAAAHARAVSELVPTELRPLVAVCSSWPPSADPSPALTSLCAAALEGGDPAGLIRALTPLAELPTDVPGELARELHDWVVAGRDTARAGIAAAHLLAGTGEPATVRGLLEVAEAHQADVLRSVIPPFVRAVLDRRRVSWTAR